MYADNYYCHYMNELRTTPACAELARRSLAERTTLDSTPAQACCVGSKTNDAWQIVASLDRAPGPMAVPLVAS